MDVSRETREKLEKFSALLTKWTGKINLIGPSTVSDVWSRHILDSVQIYKLAPRNWKTWVDLGSGGGLPGIVVAVLASEDDGKDVTLVESDVRKCAFLRTALRETATAGKVVNARIEDCDPMGADVLSARALAPLPRLMEFADRHLGPGGVALFSKGQKASNEIDEALEGWRFACEKHASETDANGVILRIGDLKRV